jgi:hypothetical protein
MFWIFVMLSVVLIAALELLHRRFEKHSWIGRVRDVVVGLLIGAAIAPYVNDVLARQRDAENRQREQEAARLQPLPFSGTLEPQNWYRQGEWIAAWRTSQPVIDWPTMEHYDAVANISVRIIDARTLIPRPDAKGFIRIVALPSGNVIGEREVSDGTGDQAITLPRTSNRTQYELQVKVMPDTAMGVDGKISFAPKK